MQKSRHLLALLCAGILITPLSTLAVSPPPDNTALTTARQADTTVEVYKSPWCGCCKDWISHLNAHGFETRVKELENLDDVKAKAGLTPELASCHTAFVQGYVIEGHVPAKDIQRLLTEKPAIRGLTVPGMPAGKNVPGMEVNQRNATFDVLAIDQQGDVKIWQHYE